MRHPRVRSLSTMAAAEQARGRLKQLRLGYCGGMSFRGIVRMVEHATGFAYSPKSAERAEKGTSRLDAEWVIALCQATGASAGWLLQGQGEAPAWAMPTSEAPVPEDGEPLDLMAWLEDVTGAAPGADAPDEAERAAVAA